MKTLKDKIYVGKYYVAIRFSNDLCLGIGRPDERLKQEVVRARPHRNI